MHRGQDDHKRTRDGKGNIAESSEHKRQRKLEVMELIQQTSDSIPIPQPDSGPLVSTKLVLKGGATSAKAKTNKPTARGKSCAKFLDLYSRLFLHDSV